MGLESRSNGSSRLAFMSIAVVAVLFALFSVMLLVRLSDSEELIVNLLNQNKVLSSNVTSLLNLVDSLQKQVSFYRSALEGANTRQTRGGSGASDQTYGSKGITGLAVYAKEVDPFFGVVSWEGTTFRISVQVSAGQGRVLVNTKPLMGVDFQSAARVAADVAASLTKFDLSGVDVIFYIESNSTIEQVDGPSAGGGMTVALVSQLQGSDLREDVAMTGTIEPDGSIGQVGGIAEKAEAAGKAGTKLLLVPVGERVIKVAVPREVERLGWTFVVYDYVKVDLNENMLSKYGMKVQEVRNIQEAMEQFRLS